MSGDAARLEGMKRLIAVSRFVNFECAVPNLTYGVSVIAPPTDDFERQGYVRVFCPGRETGCVSVNRDTKTGKSATMDGEEALF